MTAEPTFLVLHPCTLSDKTGAAKRVRRGDTLVGAHWERFVRRGVIEAQPSPAAVSPQPKEMVVGEAPSPAAEVPPAPSGTALFSEATSSPPPPAASVPTEPPPVTSPVTSPVETPTAPTGLEKEPVLLRSVDEMSKGELLMLAEKHKIVGADKMPVRELRKALERAVS